MTFEDAQKAVDAIVIAKVAWESWNKGYARQEVYNAERDRAATLLLALIAAAPRT